MNLSPKTFNVPVSLGHTEPVVCLAGRQFYLHQEFSGWTLRYIDGGSRVGAGAWPFIRLEKRAAINLLKELETLTDSHHLMSGQAAAVHVTHHWQEYSGGMSWDEWIGEFKAEMQRAAHEGLGWVEWMHTRSH